MDKQIRTIISILKQNGGSMTYGVLFEKTADIMDALSATLSTARKRGVVEVLSSWIHICKLKYEASALLMQGIDDSVVITLLKDELPDSEVYKSKKYDKEEVLQALNAPKGPEKCVVCNKVVYPTERIAPNNKVRIIFPFSHLGDA
jgi:hypothetical protein